MLKNFEILSKLTIGTHSIFFGVINAIEEDCVVATVKRLDFEGKLVDPQRRKFELDPFLNSEIVLEVGTIFKLTLAIEPGTMMVTYNAASVKDQLKFNTSTELL